MPPPKKSANLMKQKKLSPASSNSATPPPKPQPPPQPSIGFMTTTSRTSNVASGSSSSTVVPPTSSSRSQGFPISSINFATSQPVYFPKPLVIIYRFLNVLKSRNKFVFEIVDYVERSLYQFLKEYWNNEDLMALVEELRIESYYDSCLNEDAPVIFRSSQAPEAVQDSIVMYVLWKCYKFRECLDIGRDNPGLKRLIHYVVLDGIVSSQFRLSVEQSVMQTVERISRQGIRQYLISTIAHKLFDNQRLLAFTDKGDIMPYFGYLDGFNIDTRKKQTFVQIAKKFNLPPSCILFVGFSNTECKKAARAGFMVAKIKEKDQKPPKYYTIRIIPELASIQLLDHQIGVPKSSSATNNGKDKPHPQQ